ncbi:ABC transporter [Arthrobacter alpinus]|uniref:ABC transporter n=1 Tax=Arthrobacter alpinus TaxID=656366 RepID=A0A0M4QWI1_9MICC|nr:ABC transporter ATP-binding protein [Arthrobacter alpinus]ALE91314.1 ABC transporter [Arthrobacter alpinus]
MLSVTDVVKSFKSGDQTIRPVNGVSFAIEQGTFAAILGKSGGGKSTLLSLLGALDKATSGDVIVDGVNISKLPDGKLTAYRRDDIGFVFQAYDLIPNLSAQEGVMLPMEFAGVSHAKRSERADERLNQVGLTEEMHQRKANRLSGGLQQRVALARALANNPNLILADEPTGTLDDETGEMIIKLLHQLAHEKETAILVVTHDQALAGQTDRKFRVSRGKITEDTPKVRA